MTDNVLSLINIKSVCGTAETGAPYGSASREALEFSRELLQKLGIKTRVYDDCVAVGETGDGQLTHIGNFTGGEIPGANRASSQNESYMVGSGKPELGILVHVDVVDAIAEAWSSDPFRGEVRDGNEYGETEPIIYGRGAIDNKGPAVAAFYALRCALDVTGGLGKPAQIIVGSAEELGCIDVNKYAETYEMPPKTLAPDSSFPLVNLEKGRFTLKFTRDFNRR